MPFNRGSTGAKEKMGRMMSKQRWGKYYRSVAAGLVLAATGIVLFSCGTKPNPPVAKTTSSV